MTKHLADHRTPSSGARVRQFVRLDRQAAQTDAPPPFARGKDRTETKPQPRRLIEFLRIERGRTA